MRLMTKAAMVVALGAVAVTGKTALAAPVQGCGVCSLDCNDPSGYCNTYCGGSQIIPECQYQSCLGIDGLWYGITIPC